MEQKQQVRRDLPRRVSRSLVPGSLGGQRERLPRLPRLRRLPERLRSLRGHPRKFPRKFPRRVPRSLLGGRLGG